MAIRTILVPVSGAARGDPALDVALLVGRQAGAHVEVLHVRPDPRDAAPILGEGVSAAMIQEMMEAVERDARLRAERARTVFDVHVSAASLLRIDGRPTAAEASSGQLSVSWREAVGREDDEVARRGRLFDLVVVARPGGEDNIAAETTLEAALLESGRPVLVAPPNPCPTVGKRIAIAWNASTAAARAVAAASSFLSRAEYVTILEGDDAAADSASADELATLLAWRGASASLHRFRSDDAGIGAGLLAAAVSEGADMLVMGGYGHSRLREMIFGGATIDTIFASNLPLLMTH